MNLNKFWFIFIIIILILGIIGFGLMITEWMTQEKRCASEYGGNVIGGYCTYVSNGNSTSYYIWEKAQIKKEMKK